MEYKYTGIILNKHNVGEMDRIYTIYTLEGGKIKSLAKSVRKPHAKLAAALENITLADITVEKTKGMGKITGAIIEDSFTNLKKDCNAVLEAFSILNLFDKMVDFENQDKKVFHLLKDYLLAMDKCASSGKEEKYVLLRLGFVVKLLHELGYTIEVRSCILCGNSFSEDKIAFSARQGGILCDDCAGKNQNDIIFISANAVKMTRLFLHNKMDNLSKIKTEKKDCDSLNLAVEQFLKWIA
jgi:DNA repair protein RecO (recombination protein O)